MSFKILGVLIFLSMLSLKASNSLLYCELLKKAWTKKETAYNRLLSKLAAESEE